MLIPYALGGLTTNTPYRVGPCEQRPVRTLRTHTRRSKNLSDTEKKTKQNNTHGRLSTAIGEEANQGIHDVVGRRHTPLAAQRTSYSAQTPQVALRIADLGNSLD